MDTDYQTLYWQLEQTHWWFQGRAHFILGLLPQLRIPGTAAILEVGCSAGPLMRRLRAGGFSNVTGIDLSEDAIRRCHADGLPNTTVMDATDPRYPDRSFDLLIASDVLEHIVDESAALGNWLRILRPGGHLVVCVPAFRFLWSHHDTVNHHQRRYTRKGLRKTLHRAGFIVRRGGYWNFSLFFPVAAVRLAQRMLPSSRRPTTGQLHAAGPAVNSVLYSLLRAENRLLFHSWPLPLGVSAFAIATRPDGSD